MGMPNNEGRDHFEEALEDAKKLLRENGHAVLDKNSEEEARTMVRNLEWDDFDDFSVAYCEFPFNYIIETWEYGITLIKMGLLGLPNEDGYMVDVTAKRNPSEAKEYCQRDYEERVLRSFGFDFDSDDDTGKE